MASRRQGIQIFRSLFKIVRSELAAGNTGTSSTASDAWLHLPSIAQPQQLVSLRGFASRDQTGIAASAKQAKEAISDVVKSAAKQAPRTHKGAKTASIRKGAKPNAKSKLSTEQDAVDSSQMAQSRRETSAADAATSIPTKSKSRPKTVRSSQQEAGPANLAQKDSKPARKRSATAAPTAVKPALRVSSMPPQQPLPPQASATAQPSSNNIAEASTAKAKSSRPAAAPAPASGLEGQTSKKVLNLNSRPVKGQGKTAQGPDSQSEGAEIADQAADGKLTAKRRSRRRVQQPVTAEPVTATLSLPSYQNMKQHVSEDRGELTNEEEEAIRNHMLAFQGSANVQDQALSLYVNAELFNKAVEALEEFLLQSVTPSLARAFVVHSPGKAAEDPLFNLFAEYVVHNYSHELQAYRNRVQSVDMRQSHLWYPVARALDRKIIYHAGPTNSGKTYNALKAMKEAGSGVYCGPLRLLAMEVYDTINQEGILCNLYTGQERRQLEGAMHASCTVEMINTTKHWDCAVLDEIQMIGDDQRGWAWTRALQGLPANEIHLCGDASALPLVKQLCDNMGETLTVCNYNRFTELEIEPRSLPHAYRSVQAGDAVVAFSRREIFDIKADIERHTPHKCCVIYGALPPEMRRHQAALFNDPDSGFDVLVASDAVGMGLNLNIRRIIFHKVQKFEGKELSPVSPSAIKQIAGRAGRRNSRFPKGLVGTHNPSDLPRVIEAVNMPLADLSTPAAGLFPEFQHLELLAGQVPDDAFGTLLERFSNEAKLEGTFFFCRQDGVMQVARLLEKVDNLSLEDRFDFCMAPAQIRDNRQAAALLHFAARYASGLPVTLDINVPKVVPATAEDLRHMEATHQVISLWIWLSHRFGSHAFPGLEKVMEQSEGMIQLMNQGLAKMCHTNRRSGRRKSTKPSGPPKYNLQAALLQRQDPLALAYLADAKHHKTIYNTEWAEPDEPQVQAVAVA